MKTLFWIMIVPFVFWFVVQLVVEQQFEINCTGYIMQAAHANSIQLAEQSLSKAVDYANSHGLTEGYTSVLYRSPDEDIGFWHENLTQALAELRQVSPSASDLEKSNILLKLRESLIGHSGSVKSPTGIEWFPINRKNAWIGVLAFVAAAIGVIGLLYVFLDD